MSKNEIESLIAKNKLVSEFFETFSFIIEPDQETVYQISEKQIFETLEKRQYKHLNKDDIIHSLIKLKEHSLSPDRILYDDLGEFAQFAKHLQGISSTLDKNNR